MRAFSLIKLFTVVGLVVTANIVFAVEPTQAQIDRFKTYEECLRRLIVPECEKSEYEEAQDGIYESAGVSEGPSRSKLSTTEAKDKCEQRKRDGFCKLGNFPDPSQITQCETLFNTYNTAILKVNDDCTKEGQSNISMCMMNASQCAGALDMGVAQGDNPVAGINNVLNALQSVQTGDANSKCFDQNDSTQQNQQKQIQQKIFELQQEINKSILKKADLDNEVNKKTDEIEKEKITAQKEANKEISENKTNLAKKKAAIDKAILELKTKQLGRLVKINGFTRDLANAQFKIQQFLIQFGDKQIQSKCGAESDKMALEKKAGIPPKGSPPSVKAQPHNLTKKDRNEIDLAYQTCLKISVLAKQAELKKVQDEQAKARDEIMLLTQSNQQDNEAIETQKIEFEQEKKNVAESEKASADIQLRTTKRLDDALVRFKQQAKEKLASIEAENKARPIQMQELYIQKQNVKPKYSSIPATLAGRKNAQENFVNQCCGESKGSTDTRCIRVKNQDTELNSGGFGGVNSWE